MTLLRIVVIPTGNLYRSAFQLWDPEEHAFVKQEAIFPQAVDGDGIYSATTFDIAENEATAAGHTIDTKGNLKVRAELYQKGITFTDVQIELHEGLYAVKGDLQVRDAKKQPLAFRVPANVSDVRLLYFAGNWVLREEVEAAGSMLPGQFAWKANQAWPLNRLEIDPGRIQVHAFSDAETADRGETEYGMFLGGAGDPFEFMDALKRKPKDWYAAYYLGETRLVSAESALRLLGASYNAADGWTYKDRPLL